MNLGVENPTQMISELRKFGYDIRTILKTKESSTLYALFSSELKIGRDDFIHNAPSMSLLQQLEKLNERVSSLESFLRSRWNV
jgi:hypothetical protein